MRKSLFIWMMLAMFMIACSTPAEKRGRITVFDNDAVLVYYFHGKQQCAGCNSIKQIAGAAVSEHFSDNSKVQFVVVDFSVRENKHIADKFEIAWSSLVIAHGDEFVNLTDEAFKKVFTEPTALKNIIIDTINHYLNIH